MAILHLFLGAWAVSGPALALGSLVAGDGPVSNGSAASGMAFASGSCLSWRVRTGPPPSPKGQRNAEEGEETWSNGFS